MSTQMSVVMNAGDVPDGFAPEDVDIGNGQNILPDFAELSDLAESAGLDRLDRFIVDHCALVDAACKAGEPSPDPDPSVGINPFDDRDEPIFFGPPGSPLNRNAELERIEAEVERAKPWFEPAEGLRTVRGLIQMLEAGIDPALRERLREPRARRLAASGIPAKYVDVMTRLRDLTGALWDLQGFERQLDYLQRIGVRFHFGVSY